MQPDACSSLYILISIYLLLRIATEESRCATGSLVTDIEFISDRYEAPSTWLVGICGTSSSEFPWSVILEQLRGDDGSNHELPKISTKVWVCNPTGSIIQRFILKLFSPSLVRSSYSASYS